MKLTKERVAKGNATRWKYAQTNHGIMVINMSLDLSFFPLSHLGELSMSYDWDDWDPYEVVGEADDEILDRLSKLSLELLQALL
ncbi:MAG: hypothetical protein HC877_22645 [Thioploca sp.]|nr:hypothetical protein [Thioploca sp.]